MTNYTIFSYSHRVLASPSKQNTRGRNVSKSIDFTRDELQWLQWMTQAINEEQGTFLSPIEHTLLTSLRDKVRLSMVSGNGPVAVEEDENRFFQNLIEGWKENAGNYMYLENVPRGPIVAGGDTIYGTGLSGSAIAERQFQHSINIIEDVLHKLRT